MPANELAMSLAPIELLPVANCSSVEFMLAFNIILCLLSLFYMAQAFKFMKITSFFEKKLARLDQCLKDLQMAEPSSEKLKSESSLFDGSNKSESESRLAIFQRAHRNNVLNSQIIIQFKKVA